MATLIANEETLNHILGLIRSAKIPVPALLEVTRARIEEEATSEPDVLREYLENRATSKEAMIAKAAGETIPVEAVAALLQIGTAGVHKAKDEGRILAYQEPGRRTYKFPVFQFDGAAVAPWVIELIEIVGNGFAALHFLTVERKSLKNQSFLGRIRGSLTKDQVKVIDEVLVAARNFVPEGKKHPGKDIAGNRPSTQEASGIPLPVQFHDRIQSLVSLGKKQGHLTLDDIKKSLCPDYLGKPLVPFRVSIRAVLSIFRSLNIEVREVTAEDYKPPAKKGLIKKAQTSSRGSSSDFAHRSTSVA